ncbi:uncharacterized protein MELLADRAFT_59572 [Melampsora larici-populina 98AG31]|uniref:J domain-containing protein n=1 Tax=Melampsora larici-populina (strain 98AG31 / pathotype 3-4-7) TaxID=747676 RepID=F4R801_MELLP|nr:uncharacterized protein MELLADRAFT_59572 [Melampsora larici-populina 98AG31]EGG11700.1 hypothetical protein MELLADRAFT_59572 [Melampsora larici-populina 98AG31]
MASEALPTIWSYWKSEALLRLGKLTEAQGEVVVALTVSDNPKVPSLTKEEKLWITGLMAYVKHDLEDASKRLNSSLLLNDKDIKIRKLYNVIESERESDLQKLNYYEVLQVPLGATDVEICAAYKSRALMIHPDRGNAKSHMEMSYLSGARDALLDPQERRKYDMRLALKSEGK